MVAGVGKSSSRHVDYLADGRSLGSAYVLLKDAKDIAVAVAKDRQELGGRWLEIYKADRAELFRATGSFAALRGDASYGGVVLLSGLPFRIGPKDIMKFCAGYEIQRNGVYVVGPCVFMCWCR